MKIKNQNNSIQKIKELRQQTGASIRDVREALQQSQGDEEKAKKFLKQKGKLIAEKKSTRETKEGWLGCYIHNNGKVGAVVELICETDFVASNKEFQELAHDLALQVTASNPRFIKPEQVKEEELKEEIKEIDEDLAQEDKPQSIKAKIKQGKLRRIKNELSLYSQPFIKDNSRTVEDLINEKIMKLGENIQVRNFYYFSL